MALDRVGRYRFNLRFVVKTEDIGTDDPPDLKVVTYPGDVDILRGQDAELLRRIIDADREALRSPAVIRVPELDPKTGRPLSGRGGKAKRRT